MKSVAYLQGSDIKYYVFLAISVKIEQTQFTGNQKCSGDSVKCRSGRRIRTADADGGRRTADGGRRTADGGQ